MSSNGRTEGYEPSDWGSNPYTATESSLIKLGEQLKKMEGKAAALERRLVLKTRFLVQLEWGSGPLSSASGM